MHIDRVYNSAMAKLISYWHEAKMLDIGNADFATLATVDTQSQPNVRIITIHDITHQGFLFLANKYSGKISQLIEQPKAGLCLYWSAINIQTNIEGIVTPIDDVSSDSLWQKREHHAQLAAWVLEKKAGDGEQNYQDIKKAVKQEFSGKVPIANSWQGYCLKPTRINISCTDWKKHHQFSYEKKEDKWINLIQ